MSRPALARRPATALVQAPAPRRLSAVTAPAFGPTPLGSRQDEERSELKQAILRWLDEHS